MMPLVDVFVVLFGASVGSFVNACAYRMPRGLSLVYSRSRCARCQTVVPWYHNIPILSALILRARCAYCHVGFGWSHLIVEALMAYVALNVFQRFGPTLQGATFFTLFATCVTLSLIDWEFKIIPDELSLGGLIMSLALSGLATWQGYAWWISFPEALVGAIAGAGSLWGVNALYESLFRRTGIGFGDVKLLAFLGANCGAWGVLVTIFIASFLGSLMGLALMFFRGHGRRTAIPFGPFLCLGWFVAMHDRDGRLSSILWGLLGQ